MSSPVARLVAANIQIKMEPLFLNSFPPPSPWLKGIHFFPCFYLETPVGPPSYRNKVVREYLVSGGTALRCTAASFHLLGASFIISALGLTDEGLSVCRSSFEFLVAPRNTNTPTPNGVQNQRQTPGVSQSEVECLKHTYGVRTPSSIRCHGEGRPPAEWATWSGSGSGPVIRFSVSEECCLAASSPRRLTYPLCGSLCRYGFTNQFVSCE